LEVVGCFYENKKGKKESQKWREIKGRISLLGNGGLAHPYYKKVEPDQRRSSSICLHCDN
jgi:hypothetical protein